MATPFYLRTTYRLSEEPVPACFLTLDDHFAAKLPPVEDGALHYGMVLAELVCSRMADVEMYAFLMDDARQRQSLKAAEMNHDADLKTAVMTRAFLVAYLGACRALLDAAALTLGTLYEIPLTGSECSFRNGDFWHQFVMLAPNAHRRYHGQRLFYNEVNQWADETASRIAPLVLLQHHYGAFARREVLLQALDERHIDIEDLTAEGVGRNWIDPLVLHTRWKPQLLTLCERLCLDIAEQV
jgi:hypothetical protein